MKLWKCSLLFVGVTVLLMSSLTVSASTVSDDQEDVLHFINGYYEQTPVSKPSIDIQEISADISGDEITLTVTLWPGGTFNRGDDQGIILLLYYNTSDATYIMTYTDYIGIGAIGATLGAPIGTGGYIPSSGEVVINGNTLTSTLNKVGDDETAIAFCAITHLWEYYGTAEQYTGQHWTDIIGDFPYTIDYAPNGGDSDGDGDGDGDGTGDGDGDSDGDGAGDGDGDGDGTGGDGDGDGDEDGSGSGTPGFETLAVIAALGVALIILRRKK